MADQVDNSANLFPCYFERIRGHALQQVISGIKIGAVPILSAIALLVFVHFIPVHRIEAYFWHIRHGNSIEVGGFICPALREWYVERISSDDVMMVNLKTGDGINVAKTANASQSSLAVWSQIMSRPAVGNGIRTRGRREIQLGGDPFVCIEQEFDVEVSRFYPIDCRSSGALELRFTPNPARGRERDEVFYSLLAQTRKR
jgi:hypothetical protein